MFDIRDVNYGWLVLNIGGNEFCCSYLTDVKEELQQLKYLYANKLLCNQTAARLEFDGEGPMLYLNCFLEEYLDILHIIWEEYNEEDGRPTLKHISVPYDDFIGEVDSWFEKNETLYHEKFEGEDD